LGNLRGAMYPGLLITDYQKYEAFPLMKSIRRYVYNMPLIKIYAKTDFYIFVFGDLDI